MFPLQGLPWPDVMIQVELHILSLIEWLSILKGIVIIASGSTFGTTDDSCGSCSRLQHSTCPGLNRPHPGKYRFLHRLGSLDHRLLWCRAWLCRGRKVGWVHDWLLWWEARHP